MIALILRLFSTVVAMRQATIVYNDTIRHMSADSSEPSDQHQRSFLMSIVSCDVHFFISQVVTERKVLEVHITKGMRSGQKITFSGESDEAPGTIPGDIIFIVEEKVRAAMPAVCLATILHMVFLLRCVRNAVSVYGIMRSCPHTDPRHRSGNTRTL